MVFVGGVVGGVVVGVRLWLRSCSGTVEVTTTHFCFLNHMQRGQRTENEERPETRIF